MELELFIAAKTSQTDGECEEKKREIIISFAYAEEIV